jgi:hypothetical protein
LLQALHNKGQSEHWIQHLVAMIRNVQSKVKKALSYTKEEQFFIDFSRWFQNYARLANDVVNKLANWYGTMQKLFRLEIECSYLDAEKFLSMGKGKWRFLFPLITDF